MKTNILSIKKLNSYIQADLYLHKSSTKNDSKKAIIKK